MPTVPDNQSVVTPLSAVKRQRLDGQLRQLEFSAQLHRKLDLQLLLETFLSEGQAFVHFDGVQFLASGRGQDMLLGDVRQHRQRFALKLGDRELGDLLLMRATPFTAREERETERMMESLVYPLDNALAHYVALMQTMTDRVTGLQNQLALNEQLPREIRLARRGEQPLAVLLIMVDYLESISEHHGSDIGQQAWQAVADGLSASLRASDAIYRTERDEFFVVLNHTDLDGACHLAERLRSHVDRCVSVDNVQFVLTASAGVTELDEQDDATSLIVRVEQALQRARQSGRNQIYAQPAEHPSGDDEPIPPDPHSVA